MHGIITESQRQILGAVAKVEWLKKPQPYIGRVASEADVDISKARRDLVAWIKRGEIFTRGYGSGTTYHLCAEQRQGHGLSVDPTAPTKSQLLEKWRSREVWRSVMPPEVRTAVFNALIKLHVEGNETPSLTEVAQAVEPREQHTPPQNRVRSALERLEKAGFVAGSRWERGRLLGPYKLTEWARELFSHRIPKCP